MPKTFKTASLAGYGALGDNAATLKAWAMQNPDILKQIGGEQALNDYIAQHQQAVGWNSEANGDFKFTPETEAIDKLLSGYQMNSVGAAGLDDGRAKAIVKDGQTLYTGDAYSYKPAKDNLDTVLKGAALVGGAYGLFSPGGMLSGLGGAAETTAGAAAEAGGAAASAGGGAAGAAGADAGIAAALEATGQGAASLGASGAGGAAAATVGDVSTKAALFGNAGYGAGMTGAATSAFDTVLGLTGSTSLAAGAADVVGAAMTGGDWLTNSIKTLTGSGGAGGGLLGSLLGNSSILGLIGAGVQQYNLEKMAEDQRSWLDKKESDARRRRMPTTGAGMLGKFRVIPGAPNGG